MVTIKTYFKKMEILNDSFYNNLAEMVRKRIQQYGYKIDDIKYQWQTKPKELANESVYNVYLTLECRYLIRKEDEMDISAKFLLKDYKIISSFQ